MDLGLAGKAFIVTGGTDGLGFATVQSLVAEGANVLVTGRTHEKYTRACKVLGSGAEMTIFEPGDNADPALPARLQHAVLARWGRLDGLLVSAGGPAPGRALSTDDDMWRSAFESVFLGAVRLVRDLSAVMEDGGAIALVLATSAREMAPGIPISSGLRPGLALLMKNFAEELGPRNIRVNALLPGMFATDRVKQLLADTSPDTSGLTLKRMGEPVEFGKMATVMLSSAASYVTGAAIAVDGGQVKVL
ncbi:MAG TPA: SDR family oxidoreductase [Telluria sp.]|jgi:3-oxoacyl-[acyl-carrier protein] reductase